MQSILVILFISALFSGTVRISQEFRENGRALISGQISLISGNPGEAAADLEDSDIFPESLPGINRFLTERYDIPYSVRRYNHSKSLTIPGRKLLPCFIDLPPPCYL